MKYRLRILTLAVGLCLPLRAIPAQATILTFDDLGPDIAITSYGGLEWLNFLTLDGPAFGFGYANGTVSPDIVAFNGFGGPAAVSTSSFDFTGAYLTAAWVNGLLIEVTGFSEGVPIYDEIRRFDTGPPAFSIFNYAGIDTLQFTAFLDADSQPAFEICGDCTNFAVDDFTVTIVPEPTSLLLLGTGAATLVLRGRRRASGLPNRQN